MHQLLLLSCAKRNYVTVEKSRQCHTSSTLVHWPNDRWHFTQLLTKWLSAALI